MSAYYGYKDYEEVQDELKKQYEKDEGKGYNNIYKLTCKVCGNVFYCKNKRAAYCSYRCTNDGYMQRRRERNVKTARKCQQCGADFIPARQDAKYCSAACRQKNFRKRNG